MRPKEIAHFDFIVQLCHSRRKLTEKFGTEKWEEGETGQLGEFEDEVGIAL